MALRVRAAALALLFAAATCFAHMETNVKAEAGSDADGAAKAAGSVGGLGQRCGGQGWNGTTTCLRGLACNHTNMFWWDCQTEADVAKAEAKAKKHLSRSDVVAQINSRFANGGPSSDVTSAGIVIHQFHNGMDGDWKAWMPCPTTCFGGPCWCASFSDRFSASLINAHTKTQKGKIGMYSLQNPGFIYSPEVAHISCAYPADGGSESKSCKPDEAGCVPGCGKKWCRFDPTMPNNMDTSCAWPPNELERVLRLQEEAKSNYNEIVIDAKSVVDNLPRSIEAIFFVKGEKAEAEARKVHEDFLATFAETSLAARNMPLLELDPENPAAPFTDVTSGRSSIAAFELGSPGAGAASSPPAAAVAAGVAMAVAMAVSLFAMRVGALRRSRTAIDVLGPATGSLSPSTEAADVEVVACLLSP